MHSWIQTTILLGILLSCTYLTLAVYKMLKAVQYIRDTGKKWLGVDVRDNCRLVKQHDPKPSVVSSLMW